MSIKKLMIAGLLAVGLSGTSVCGVDDQSKCIQNLEERIKTLPWGDNLTDQEVELLNKISVKSLPTEEEKKVMQAWRYDTDLAFILNDIKVGKQLSDDQKEIIDNLLKKDAKDLTPMENEVLSKTGRLK